IGGRIVPAFTANALRRHGGEPDLVTRAWLEYVVIGLMVAIAVVDVFAPNGVASGVLAALAALAHAGRLAGWRSFRTRGEPILWILHVAYAWLPVGLALKACALLGDAAWASKWLPALATGVIAGMILAVMTRVALGHTGRPLVVARPISIAYLLLMFTALLRTFGLALFPAHYLLTLEVAALTWMASFGIFLVVYAPILCRPRADGRPG
ncbi:MAG TPA: NnrS family protein, partial [Steroidobacteraceae bacterium]|nr:NnrS family protein [Steroidobacteraceae bacterium]